MDLIIAGECKNQEEKKSVLLLCVKHLLVNVVKSLSVIAYAQNLILILWKSQHVFQGRRKQSLDGQTQLDVGGEYLNISNHNALLNKEWCKATIVE